MALVSVGASRTEAGLRHNLDIKETGQKTKVKDDCRTKLMYYLNCFSAISKFNQVHPEWIKYTEYKTCTSWTLEEEEELFHICEDEISLAVAQTVGFIEAPDELLGTSSNTFFDVTNTDEVLLNHVQVHIDENSIYAGCISAGAKRELKFKVMMYRRSWINENYYNPLRNLSNMIERHKREKREEEERKRRKIHNEEVLNDNMGNCCLITEREGARYPNLVKFVVILYFIHSITLLLLYLKTDQIYYIDMPWLKWVYLGGFLVSIINCVFALISVIIVCIASCFKNWIVYLKILIELMMILSMISIGVSLFMYSYDVFIIIKVLISVTLSTFSCVLYKETNVNSACKCLCYGKLKVSPEAIDYYL